MNNSGRLRDGYTAEPKATLVGIEYTLKDGSKLFVPNNNYRHVEYLTKAALLERFGEHLTDKEIESLEL